MNQKAPTIAPSIFKCTRKIEMVEKSRTSHASFKLANVKNAKFVKICKFKISYVL